MDQNSSTNTQSTGFGKTMIVGMLRLLMLFVLMAAALFGCAGTWRWWEAWAYIAQGLIVVISGRAYIILKQPDMAMERAEAHQKENVQSWDRYLMPFTALYGPILSWIVVGLDFRFGLSAQLPLPYKLAGLLAIFLGGMLGTWAMISNRFFSSQVRIQSDRDHRVVSGGPYRFVRHPGYAGGVLSWIAAPFFFSSFWLVVLAVVVIVAMIARTALEDAFLQENLPGYKEYSKSVRYRLLPGIW